MKVEVGRIVFAVVLSSLVAGAAGQARADILFNQTVSQFDPPGSSGEVTGGFQTTTATNGDLIGLRASERYVGYLTQTNTATEATYYATTGLSSSPPADAAKWNIDYIFIPASGSLTGYTVSLTMTGLNGGSAGPVTLTSDYTTVNNTTQDSTNLGYISGSLPAGVYDPNQAGTYTFTLTLSSNNGPSLSETIVVDVVPEPSSFAIAAVSALAFMGYAWRRRSRRVVSQPNQV